MADKELERLLRGGSDANFRFESLRRILRTAGFSERIKGSHHVYSRTGVEEIINLQSLPNGKAKVYQVKQVRGILTRYRLVSDDKAHEV